MDLRVAPNDSGVILRHKAVATKPWTSRELGQLRRHADMGAEGVAEILGRTVQSVKSQAKRQRVSLRPPGERRGLILGQPRGVSLDAASERIPGLRELRAAVLAGDVDMARVERRARPGGGELCPKCARRPQEVASTGLCEDCHLRALAEGHRLEKKRAEAHREWDRERQRKSRRGRA